MAKELGDGALWLPSGLLCDDLLLLEEARTRRAEAAFALGRQLGPKFAAAPPEAAPPSLEGCTAAITRQMAHASILAAAEKTTKARATAGFSHSALCGRLASGKPLCLVEQPGDGDPWDVFCEVAAQVSRLSHTRGKCLQEPSVDSQRVPPCNAKVAHYTTPSVAQQQLQAAQFRYLKLQQALKHQLSTGCGGGQGIPRGSRPHGLLQPASPAPQRHKQLAQPGNGTRAVFFSSSGNKRASAGTGVFLPRTQLCKPEPQKTPDCSTILVPARVVQTLNTGLDFGTPPWFADGFLRDHNARNGQPNAWLSHQKFNKQVTQSSTTAAAAAAAAIRDVQLPREWTY